MQDSNGVVEVVDLAEELKINPKVIIRDGHCGFAVQLATGEICVSPVGDNCRMSIGYRMEDGKPAFYLLQERLEDGSYKLSSKTFLSNGESLIAWKKLGILSDVLVLGKFYTLEQELKRYEAKLDGEPLMGIRANDNRDYKDLMFADYCN